MRTAEIMSFEKWSKALGTFSLDKRGLRERVRAAATILCFNVIHRTRIN